MNELLPVDSTEELSNLIEREMKSGFASLSTQRKAFAHEYIVDYKHRRAAKETGFSANTGIRLVREPLIAAYVEHLQSLQLTNNIITKDFINAQYMVLYEMSIGEVEQHHVLPDGTPMLIKKTELGTAHNILDKMSKSIEYAKDTGNKTAAVSISIDIDGIRGADEAIVVGEIIEHE